MTFATLTKSKIVGPSYSFSRVTAPLPEKASSKSKPPSPSCEIKDTTEIFAKEKKEKTREEKMVDFMSEYKKAERFVIVNFYTGGNGAYKFGMMDAIYAGALQKQAA